MDKLFKKIETELDSLSREDRNQILKKLREQINGLDKQIVDLLSERTYRAVLIGKVKRTLGLPTYDPEREKEINNRISSFATEPLTREALSRIYERIIDESRAAQNIEKARSDASSSDDKHNKTDLAHMLSRKQYLFIGVVFIVLLSIFTYIFYTPNYYTLNPPVRFEIKKGEPLSAIIDGLYNKGIIPSRFNMRVATFIMGAGKKLRAARYYIPNGLSYLDLIDLFTEGNADFLRKVHIRGGLTIKWMAYTLRDKIQVDSADFVNLARDSLLADSLGLKEGSLQGYLMAGDYNLYERSTAREVIDTLYNNFKNFIDDSLRNQADSLGYSIHQIVTLASIVKGETNEIDEMPKIAEVYYNRLRIGMKLQADPTVQYIQPDGWKRLTYKDLHMKSPFNTYIHAGLPPGPINNPGKNALLAAFYPEKNHYLYFVSDGEGGHNFSRSYKEHLRKVYKYRRWLRNQKRY